MTYDELKELLDTSEITDNTGRDSTLIKKVKIQGDEHQFHLYFIYHEDADICKMMLPEIYGNQEFELDQVPVYDQWDHVMQEGIARTYELMELKMDEINEFIDALNMIE